MSEGVPERGPAVPGDEWLYRVIVRSAAEVWYPGGRVSSAAFHFPVFSVDIASRTTANDTLARFPPGSGLVAFLCSRGRELAFDAREEVDPAFPTNLAHATVYCDIPSHQRKKRARALA